MGDRHSPKKIYFSIDCIAETYVFSYQSIAAQSNEEGGEYFSSSIFDVDVEDYKEMGYCCLLLIS
jgi:DNA primase catalytic subunit